MEGAPPNDTGRNLLLHNILTTSQKDLPPPVSSIAKFSGRMWFSTQAATSLFTICSEREAVLSSASSSSSMIFWNSRVLSPAVVVPNLAVTSTHLSPSWVNAGSRPATMTGGSRQTAGLSAS